jgi:hypothetical protein
MIMNGVNDADAFVQFEQSKISRLLSHLEGLQQKIKNGSYPAIRFQLKEGKIYSLNSDGIGVAFWDPVKVADSEISAPAYAPHIRFGLTPSEFVKNYVKTPKKADEIAEVLGAKL